MAIDLMVLYAEIEPEKEVFLLTDSCFGKKIDWVHIVEQPDFAEVLHGNELVFNSSLNAATEEERKDYIDKLMKAHAGGLIVALQEDSQFSKEMIAYCNEQRFPVFRAGWDTSYLNIMRRFSQMLLTQERNEITLSAAFKNAIYYPTETHTYCNSFERNGFSYEMPYVVVVVECKEEQENSHFIERALRHMLNPCVTTREKDKFLILTTGYSEETLREVVEEQRNLIGDARVGIGTIAATLADIATSYHNALKAYELVGVIVEGQTLCYNELGTYQILSNVQYAEILYPTFVKDTLGKLINYDCEHGTSYMELLECYFENDCNITKMSEATFYHQNTLKYKIKAIKEILGYDILSNENRVKIMLSLYILRLGYNKM